jgi:hypothetical protein
MEILLQKWIEYSTISSWHKRLQKKNHIPSSLGCMKEA